MLDRGVCHASGLRNGRLVQDSTQPHPWALVAGHRLSAIPAHHGSGHLHRYWTWWCRAGYHNGRFCRTGGPWRCEFSGQPVWLGPQNAWGWWPHEALSSCSLARRRVRVSVAGFGTYAFDGLRKVGHQIVALELERGRRSRFLLSTAPACNTQCGVLHSAESWRCWFQCAPGWRGALRVVQAARVLRIQAQAFGQAQPFVPLEHGHAGDEGAVLAHHNRSVSSSGSDCRAKVQQGRPAISRRSRCDVPMMRPRM